MDYLCSTLKTWSGYWTLRLKEYWGYVNFPTSAAKRIPEVQNHFGKTHVRLERAAVEHWLARYRELADVRADYTSKRGAMAKEGDEPWFSTGMGAIVIASASGLFRSITLVGFDNLTSGERENFHTLLRPHDHKFPPHAWNVERAMVPEISAHYEVPICAI